MRYSPLLLLAQAAALSSAFLIPPEISEEQLQELALPIDIGSGLALSKVSMSRIIRIPCDSCKYVEDGVATDLVLDFNLPENHHNVLTLNGNRILPMEEAELAPLKATQMPHDLATVMYFVDKSKFPTVALDNTLLVSTDFVAKDGSRQLTIETNILAVDGTPVQVEGIRMVVAETPSGELTFGRVDPLPKGLFKSCGMDVKCIFEKMMTKMRKTKLPFTGKKRPCKGRKGNKHGNPVIQGLEGLDIPPPHHRHGWHGHHGHKGRPGYHGSHRRPEPHHNIVFRIIAQVLIPIFVGIAAGMAVSLVGLIIGHGFVMLYHRFKAARCRRRRGEGRRLGFFGRRRRERRERRRRAEEGDEEDQKALLPEEGEEQLEAPPAYRDEDIEVVEKE